VQNAQVISILESLAGGLDPTTGAALPADLFQSPDVIRALSAAAQALKRDNARPRLAAAGARWNAEEDAAVCREYDEGTPVAQIARQHNRTPGAIRSRLVHLGRMDPGTVRVRDRGPHTMPQ
jgi:hypothetical protein